MIWGLQRMRPATAEAVAELEKLIAYVGHNRDRINYRAQRKAGYPLGSGGIESAKTLRGLVVCGQRQSHAGPAVRQVQWHLRPCLRAVSAKNTRQIKAKRS